MTKKTTPPPSPFDIEDQPVSLVAWPSEDDGRSPLEWVAQDVQTLLRGLAALRQTASEQEKKHKHEVEKIILSIIEVVDAFERVFRSIRSKQENVTPQMKIWISNFRTIKRLLGKVLREQGVTMIENLDQGFDPYWHKVSETISDPSKPDGTIVEEVSQGYVWHHQILRKAEVVVIRNI